MSIMADERTFWAVQLVANPRRPIPGRNDFRCECEDVGAAAVVPLSEDRIPCPYCCKEQYEAHRATKEAADDAA